MIYSLSKQFPNDFMVSVTSFKSSSTQHDVHFVSYRPIQREIEDKVKDALGYGYSVL